MEEVPPYYTAPQITPTPAMTITYAGPDGLQHTVDAESLSYNSSAEMIAMGAAFGSVGWVVGSLLGLGAFHLIHEPVGDRRFGWALLAGTAMMTLGTTLGFKYGIAAAMGHNRWVDARLEDMAAATAEKVSMQAPQ